MGTNLLHHQGPQLLRGHATGFRADLNKHTLSGRNELIFLHEEDPP